MRNFIIAGLLGFVSLAARGAPAPEIPLEDFIKHPQFLDVKISPRGDYLAATVMATQDTGALVIMRRSDRAVTGSMKLRGRTLVDSFAWVNDERVVLTIAEKDGALDTPSPTGELYATNFDGSKQDLLVGGRQDGGVQASRKSKYEGAALVDTLRDDDKFIIVEIYPVGHDEGTYPTLERLNVNTGSRSLLARAPVLNATYLTDSQGRVRFASGAGVDIRNKLYYRDGGNWKLINDETTSGLSIQAVGFNADGTLAYLESEEKQGPNAIYTWNPKTDERKRVARDAKVDPLALVYTHDGAQPFGVFYMDGRPKLALLDANVPEAKLLKSLAASFPGEWVSFRSFTKDGSELVFRVSSDRNPGAFYLLDKDKKATYLLSGREWIDPERMAEMQPVSFTARDGLLVHGYLTVPLGSDGKNLPLILHPHGGPFGPFDVWGYNPDVQMLANRGYAVLQVNFRGSGNYGRAFTRAGYRQWGGTMQDDLTDATHWAIKQGIADAERICIYGASYGGYASAMALAKEPDLYKCAVGYVGVYDMPMMYTRGDIRQSDTGTNFLEEALGGGKENLRARSPNYLAEEFKAPIFIIAGGSDVRAHPDHSRALRDALVKAGKPHEWLLNQHEGHGFYKEESNRELYTKMLAFFDKYIGKGSVKATAAAN